MSVSFAEKIEKEDVSQSVSFDIKSKFKLSFAYQLKEIPIGVKWEWDDEKCCLSYRK